MTLWLLLPILAPVVSGAAVAVFGWRPLTAAGNVVASAAILLAGIGQWTTSHGRTHLGAGRLLRVDALSITLLIVIGAVALLSCLASIGYLADERTAGHTDDVRARRYGSLVALFLAAMTVAVEANNLGLVWVAIEATTVATAFLVGHRGDRAAVEATWKYVIICSTGIAFAFLGTVLLYFASRHAGGGASALDFDVIAARASQLDHGVTRMAAGLLLLGYGTKAGLVPMHTWLADAHSQAPAPVSALMSGVLLAVAFSALLRVKSIVDVALGTGFMRDGLLLTGLLTVAVASGLLVAQRDLKRMLAYSSMENMGLVAIAAAAGTKLAIAAVLLQVMAHGAAKTVLFVAAGQLQSAHGTTTLADIRGVLARSRMLGAAVTAALVALVGLPPFALFASEFSIAQGLARVHLGWALGVTAVFLLIAFGALVVNGFRLLLGLAEDGAPRLMVASTTRVALLLGLTASLALGLTAGPFTHLFDAAATLLGAHA